MRQKKGCGRIDDHLSHYWQSKRHYSVSTDKWVREVYWCSGKTVREGGHRGVK